MSLIKSAAALFTIVFMLLISGCATIVGGSKYNAHILVKGGEKAKISREGLVIGYGTAFIKVKRNTANWFEFTVKQDGCDAQTFRFTSRKFRGWAFAGTIILWTGLVNGVPLPWGVALDLATGALWKPDDMEPGVVKVDHKNYVYHVEYAHCTPDKEED